LFQAKLEKLQSEISQIAKKTGITSATTLAMTAAKRPDRVKEQEVIPDVEWWDSVILNSPTYEGAENNLNKESITQLIEHPIQMNLSSK
jgi:U4/U6 small nuclear ribonucleoprotein PRP3